MRETDISKVFTENTKLIDYDSCESTIVLNNDKIYKIYKFENQLVDKEEKITFMYSIKDSIPKSFVVPSIIVKKYGEFTGVGERYVKDSCNMYDFFEYSDSVSEFLKSINRISKDIKKLHTNPNKIVLGDVHFYNILVNKYNLKHSFVDFDSCNIGDYKEDRLSGFYESYMQDIKSKQYKADENSDRLSLFLSTIYMLFDKEINYVDEKEYDSLSEKINTLKNVKDVFLSIKEFKGIPTISYMDEYIDKKDLNNKILVKKNDSIIEG